MNSIQKNFLTLPKDCVLNVFSTLCVEGLAIAKQVCSLWNQVGIQPALLDRVCKSFTFIPKSIFEGPELDSQERYRALHNLPSDILKILTTPCPIAPHAGKKIFQTHVLLHIPLQTGQNFFSDDTKNSKFFIKKRDLPNVDEMFKSLKIEQPYWTLVSKKSLRFKPNEHIQCSDIEIYLNKTRIRNTSRYKLINCLEATAFMRIRASSFLEGRLICRSEIAEKHLISNVLADGTISLTPKDCHAGIKYIIVAQKLAEKPKTFDFNSLPHDIKRHIISWIPESEFSRCSLISKHFFDSRWAAYLKAVNFAHAGTGYVQAIDYAQHFRDFVINNEVIKAKFKKISARSVSCINATKIKYTSIFEKVSAHKALFSSIKTSFNPCADFYKFKASTLDHYRLTKGIFADQALRIILDLWPQYDENFRTAIKNTHVTDETLGMLLMHIRSDEMFVNAIVKAILCGSSSSRVHTILQHGTLQHNPLLCALTRFTNTACGGVLNSKTAKYLELIVESIDSLNTEDLLYAIGCHISLRSFIKILHKFTCNSDFFKCKYGLSLVINRIIFSKDLSNREEMLNHVIEKFKVGLVIDHINFIGLMHQDFSNELLEKCIPFVEACDGMYVSNYLRAERPIISEKLLNLILDIDKGSLDQRLVFPFKDHSEQINGRLYTRFQSPYFYGKELLDLALERNYSEPFVFSILESLSEVSLEQLKIANEKAYSPELVSIMHSKTSAKWCALM